MPQTKDGQKYRVRYSRHTIPWAPNKSHYRNTLVTIQKGDCKTGHIYFGIARCKLSTDHFEKKVGRELALSRAEEADRHFSNSTVPRGLFFLDSGGICGYVHVKYVKTLLRHFESLDTK